MAQDQHPRESDEPSVHLEHQEHRQGHLYHQMCPPIRMDSLVRCHSSPLEADCLRHLIQQVSTDQGVLPIFTTCRRLRNMPLDPSLGGHGVVIYADMSNGHRDDSCVKTNTIKPAKEPEIVRMGRKKLKPPDSPYTAEIETFKRSR